MIATLSFLLKISKPAISFYWRDDTPTFCHLTTFLNFFHPSNYSIPRLVNINLGCISLKFGSSLGISYGQYREID